MSMSITAPRYGIREEIANSITHGVGIIFSVAGLVVLTVFASKLGNVWHVVSCGVFGMTLILMYTASTLCHGIRLPRAKTMLRIPDHSMISVFLSFSRYFFMSYPSGNEP